MGNGASSRKSNGSEVSDILVTSDRLPNAAKLPEGNLELELSEIVQKNGIKHTELLAAPTRGDRTLELLKATVSTVSFSLDVDELAFWLDNPANNINTLTPMVPPTAVDVSCTAFTVLEKLAQDVLRSTLAGPKTLQRKELNHRALLYQQQWRTLASTSATYHFQHPRLSQTIIVGTLLHLCVMFRGVGLGNGNAGTPDQLIPTLLAYGADPNLPDSLGFSAFHLSIAAFLATLTNTKVIDDACRSGLEQCLAVVQLMLQHGADGRAKLQPFASQALRLTAVNPTYHMFEGPLRGNRQMDAQDLVAVWGLAASAHSHLHKQLMERLRDLLEKALRHPFSPPVSMRGIGPLAPEPTPWSMALYQIVWGVSQLLRTPDNRARRRALAYMSVTAPFQLPAMAVVPLTELQELGYIPRLHVLPLDSSQEENREQMAKYQTAPAWSPTAAAELPPGCLVVYVSHRWLAADQPDDAQHTKHGQLVTALQQLAQQRGLRYDEMYCWLDYSCTDQQHPGPGMQALPFYIACCDVLLHIAHPEYSERAWCAMEQYMYSRLCSGQARYCLEDEMQLRQQEGYTPPLQNPSLGLLSDEADRLPLVMMYAVLDSGAGEAISTGTSRATSAIPSTTVSKVSTPRHSRERRW